MPPADSAAVRSFLTRHLALARAEVEALRRDDRYKTEGRAWEDAWGRVRVIERLIQTALGGHE